MGPDESSFGFSSLSSSSTILMVIAFVAVIPEGECLVAVLAYASKVSFFGDGKGPVDSTRAKARAFT